MPEPMNLYILRHAIAVPRDTPDFPDEERPLTKEGKRKMEAIAEGMRAMDLQFGYIVSSPHVRARQTADIVGEVFGQEVHLWKSLIPDSDPRQLVANLLKVRQDNILLVGHEPHLSGFVSVLICGNAEAQIELKKGGLCKLSSDHLVYGRCAKLDWLLAPAQLRQLA
jgi:phosphohistidine phosphatase